MSLALLAVLGVQDPQPPTDIQARIADSHYVVSLELRGLLAAPAPAPKK